MNKIIWLLLISATQMLYSQAVEIDTHEPFVTSYNYFFTDCIFSYDDVVVFHLDWGIVLLEENENNELVELSRLYTDYFCLIVRQGDFLYYSNCDIDDYNCNEEIQITKIDISDPCEPVECDVIELELMACTNILHVIEHYLFVMVPDLNRYCRLDLEDFSIDGYYDYNSVVTRSFGDHILGYNQTDQFIVYQNGADSLEIAADNFDLFEAHNNQSITNIHQLTNDTVCSVGYQNLVLWNISDLENWIQLDYWEINDNTCINECGNIVCCDDKLYLNTMENIYELQIDNTIEVIDILELPHQLSPHTIGHTDSKILIPDPNGIAIISRDNNDLQWCGFWGDNPIFYNHNLIGDNYFLSSMTMYNYKGLYQYNVSFPPEPSQSQILLPDNDYYLMKVSGDLFYMLDYWNNNWDLYCFDNNNLVLVTQFPYMQQNEMFNWILTDEYEDEAFYISKPVTNLLQKYNINNNEVELVFEDNFPNQKCGFIQNGIAYFLQSDGDYQNLMIYSGLDDNEVVLCNQYDNLVSGSYCFLRYLNQNYMLIQETLENISVFAYEGTGLSGQSFTLSTTGAMDFKIYENYLICCDSNYLYFYEISETSSGILEPEQFVELCYSVSRLQLYEGDRRDFLFCFGHAAVSVVEISITDEILDTEIVADPLSITTFPNPVFTNRNEQVSFQLSDQSKQNEGNYKLSVYNIKGQLVHQRKSKNDGNESLSWDCCLKNGIKAPSGVYLYKVDTGEGSSTGKFIVTK
ncbi:MAG: T9SS type A sorting domain-containing protein [Candidatus Stygibacter australis]|nr:T9SS type A sorting domain-containing protein [Candidatus Stygibacter australis]MDP8321623.1 T9SS type A sorting domain-containing protein [Candidatus Stygibacter australis]